jgi:hypothetical protein
MPQSAALAGELQRERKCCSSLCRPSRSRMRWSTWASFVQQAVHRQTALAGTAAQHQQLTNLLDADVETAAVADEVHLFQVLPSIEPVIGTAALRWGEQLLLLVEPQGFRRYASRPRQFADPHAHSQDSEPTLPSGRGATQSGGTPRFGSSRGGPEAMQLHAWLLPRMRSSET